MRADRGRLRRRRSAVGGAQQREAELRAALVDELREIGNLVQRHAVDRGEHVQWQDARARRRRSRVDRRHLEAPKRERRAAAAVAAGLLAGIHGLVRGGKPRHESEAALALAFRHDDRERLEARRDEIELRVRHGRLARRGGGLRLARWLRPARRPRDEERRVELGGRQQVTKVGLLRDGDAINLEDDVAQPQQAAGGGGAGVEAAHYDRAVGRDVQPHAEALAARVARERHLKRRHAIGRIGGGRHGRGPSGGRWRR